MKYKLFKFNENYTIQRVSDNTSFSLDAKNRDYQQFVDDIYEQGTGIIEGADVQTEIPYAAARVAEYPPIKDQLDKIYHSGIDAWKAEIKVIKDKYPKTQVGITTTEALPSWVETAIFDKQKEEYIKAVARLAQYELSVGVKNEDGSYKINIENENGEIVHKSKQEFKRALQGDSDDNNTIARFKQDDI